MKFKNVNKILVIKLRGIGDVVLATIVLDNLKAQFPDAQIDFLTEKASLPALEGLSQITSVHLFDRKSLLKRIGLFNKIRNLKYDLVLDLFANPVSAQITYLSRAKYRIGFPYKGRTYAYNILGPAERNKYHNADLHLKLLESAGIKSDIANLHFNVDEDSQNVIDKYWKKNNLDNNFVITLSPSGGWASKRIEPQVFANIGDKLISEFNCKIAVAWGPGDKNDAEEIIAFMNNAALLAPPTSLREMAAFLKKSSIVIANCSGPMHISTAVGSPTLSIHGPTIPWLQGAYGEKNAALRYEELDCIGCNLLECNKHHECFKELPIGRVVEKVRELITKNNLQPHEKN